MRNPKSRKKPKLDPASQTLLVQWIDDALAARGAKNRGDFIATFKVKAISQGTFNREVGPSGSFTQERARIICKAIGHPYDNLSNTPQPQAVGAACSRHCGLFHALNAATCDDPTQVAARRLATGRVRGLYKIVYRLVAGGDKEYEVEFKPCDCGAMLFQYVKDPDPRPLSHFGFALCIGDLLSIYMIGGSLHWVLSCHVPRQVENTPMTGIILDPNPVTAQVEANKFVLIKLNTAVARDYNQKMIADLLHNKRDVADGTLVASRL
jgi:hypothetical protein